MNIWVYDKTFKGFLSLVFDCYELKTFPEKITGKADVQLSVFHANYEVISDESKARRVWNGLKKRISDNSCGMLFHVFLSELPDIELLILRYIRNVLASPVNVEMNFGEENTLKMLQISRKVGREAQRIPMFVRFQKTADEIYYASYDPLYDVLPLVIKHFERRFADQKWIIYDTRRNYGFYYDLQKTSEIIFTESLTNPLTGAIDKNIMDNDEQLFQELWKSYFKSMCIKERINPKLHTQLLPRRFWKYLTEKQPDITSESAEKKLHFSDRHATNH